MSGIWKSDSSQKNKGKALTGWKIAEFACFFVSDLLLFTACKPQLSIEWQVSKVANIFWHIVTAQAIWFYYAFSPSSIFPLGKIFAFWRWPADRMPITFVYAQWSIILASHANSTISLWFFHSDAFLFIIINKWWKEHHGVPAFYLFFFHCVYSWQIVIWSINRCGFPHLRKSLYNGTHSNRIRGEKRSRFEWAFPMESGTWKIWMWSQLVAPTVTHPCYYIRVQHSQYRRSCKIGSKCSRGME